MSEQNANGQYGDEIDKYLDQGTGRNQKNARPGQGTFRLRCLKLRTLAKETTMPVMMPGNPIPQMMKVQNVTARVLTTKVVESTCQANPVGSLVDIYFDLKDVPGKPFIKEGNEKDMVEFVAAWYGSFGMRPKRADFDLLVGNETQVEGVDLRLVTNPRKKDIEAGKPDPFMYKNWSALPNTTEEVGARRAEIAAERAKTAAPA